MVVSNMNTKLSTSEQKPIVSWSALFLSVLCCLGFVHVEIKLHSQEEVIKSLAREAMSHGHDIYGQQLSTRQQKPFATFVSWWTGFDSDETNEAFTSEDESDSDDKNQNSSNKMTVNTNSGVANRIKRSITDKTVNNSKTLSPATVQQINRQIQLIIRTQVCAKDQKYCIQGPKGSRGRRGKRGLRGYPGKTGRMGRRGPPGKHGPPGPRGPQGPRGRTGVQGPPGPSGPRGKQGLKGDNGPPGESISAPYITVSPPSLTVNQTDSAVFRCTAGGNPIPQVMWIKPQSTLPQHVVIRRHSRGSATLRISGVLSSDEGVYTCNADSPLGSTNASVSLNVQVGAKINLSPKSTHVEEGYNLTLSCSATGQPLPVITWSMVPGSLSKNVKLSQDGGKLMITRTSKTNEGVYFCKANNLLNTDIKYAHITVLPKLQFQHTPLRKVTVSYGETIRLRCSATGAIMVSWKRQKGQLPPNHVKYPNGSLVLRSVRNQDAGVYVCTARNRFRAINSITRLVIRPKSCSDIKTADRSSRSQNYVIDPDGAGGQAPFNVYCDMSDKSGVGVTVISHNAEALTHVKQKGCGSQGCYSKDVTYTGASYAQLARLTAVSNNCEQFIKFECNNDIAFLKDKFAWWVSRDGSQMFYWGGATPGSGKCACGMTNTCQGGGVCNCKNSGSGWRQDSGLLTDKSTLPVRQLRFGDVDQSQEEGYHTLGKLKCYGRA